MFKLYVFSRSVHTFGETLEAHFDDGGGNGDEETEKLIRDKFIKGFQKLADGFSRFLQVGWRAKYRRPHKKPHPGDNVLASGELFAGGGGGSFVATGVISWKVFGDAKRASTPVWYLRGWIFQRGRGCVFDLR